MSEYSFTYRNDSFSLDKAAEATLFVKAGITDLSFLIVQDDRLLAWKDKCPLEDLTTESVLSAILTAPYKQVLIGLLPEALTLVPSDLYASDRIADYARFLDVKGEDRVFAAKLDDANQLVYKTDRTVADTLASKFNIQHTLPADRGWIAAIAKSEPGNHDIYLDTNDGQISLLNFNGGQVHFYNCFKADDINDVLYYCLFVAEQLELKPDAISLIISGHTTGGDIDRLGEFFRTVKYNDLKVVDAPDDILSHQLLSLASLA